MQRRAGRVLPAACRWIRRQVSSISLRSDASVVIKLSAQSKPPASIKLDSSVVLKQAAS